MTALSETQVTREEHEAHKSMVKARDAYDAAIMDRDRFIESANEVIANLGRSYRAAHDEWEYQSRMAMEYPEEGR